MDRPGELTRVLTLAVPAELLVNRVDGEADAMGEQNPRRGRFKLGKVLPQVARICGKRTFERLVPLLNFLRGLEGVEPLERRAKRVLRLDLQTAFRNLIAAVEQIEGKGVKDGQIGPPVIAGQRVAKP